MTVREFVGEHPKHSFVVLWQGNRYPRMAMLDWMWNAPVVYSELRVSNWDHEWEIYI